MTRVLIRTSTIARGARCSLTYGLLHLFVVRIGSRGHLRGAGNDLRRLVNADLWRVEPRSCRPCSRICHARDCCYCLEHFVEPLVDSYVLPLLLIYEIGKRLNSVFYRSLHIHRFGRSRWRRGVFLQRLGFLMLGSVQTTRQTTAFYC